MGLKVVLYVDDGICIAKSKNVAVKGTAIILKDLKDSGFLVNKESCATT